MNQSLGRLYWVTGLAGAGKSTVGHLLYTHLKNKHINTVYLDGDVMRSVFGNSAGHSAEERKKLAFQYARLCKMLTDQNLNVVCATISMFNEVRDWNRSNIENYNEIYLKVSLNVLIDRDQKGLYTSALKAETENVIGLNQNFEEPRNPDLILQNDGSLRPDEILQIILQKFNLQ